MSADRPEEPAADGLDLARQLTRATAAAANPRKKNPRRRTAAAGTATRREAGDAGPQPLAEAVERLVGEQGWDLSLRVHALFGRWIELVGPQVGEHTEPESFTDGNLIVHADSAEWATQLRTLTTTLLTRLNAELGHGSVVTVEIHGPGARNCARRRGPNSR